jgi:hypothetical protein
MGLWSFTWVTTVLFVDMYIPVELSDMNNIYQVHKMYHFAAVRKWRRNNLCSPDCMYRIL